ncbi:MAG: HEAT repeat domain-containing protein [Gemmatimonadetes bacterium]|nr:HEAT repeat domain-containing protein [Gemmatimonadota bacterium]
MISHQVPRAAATLATLLLVTAAVAQRPSRPARPTPAAPPAPTVAPAPATPPTEAPDRVPAPAARPAVAPLPGPLGAWGNEWRERSREAIRVATIESTRALERVHWGSVDGALRALPAVPVTPPLPASSPGVRLGRPFAEHPREAWADADPADSIYRLAREQLNRGDYRRAAALFKELPVKFPTSAYAADSPYWQAFCLYRIGGTADLQEALQALEAQKAKYPGARSQADALALATRIAGVLASRGQGNSDLVKRALNTPPGADNCDREDQSVRAEALSALMQTEPEEAAKLATRILGRKDECSADLRRSAVFIVGNRRDAGATASLIQVARNDPSADVRVDAIGWLPKLPGDDGLGALEELASRGDDERIQRAAVRALTVHPNPRARTAMRALVERNDANERLRMAVLDAFDPERATSEDATWMRGIYGKVDNAKVKARIASTVGRLGGDANNQWLMLLARNEAESLESRTNALRYVGRSMDIPALGKFYDTVAERPLREQLIDVLGNRKEDAATDKLIEIARNGTDPQLRRYAISALTRKKDPRTTKLLLEIIDR